jgi:uncharacterized protein (DUF433 family)
VVVAEVVELPPRGHYLAAEVGRLAGVSGQEIGQWERYGHIRASQRADEYPLVYSYQDVAEAMIVHELVLASVNLKAIGAAVQNLRAEYGAWPLAKAPLLTGHGSLAIRQGESLVDVTRVGQGLVFHPDDLERVRTALNHGGWAARDLPDLEHVEVNPDRMSGRPAIRGRRIEAEYVARIAGEADGRERLYEDYDLNDAEITDATRWWDRVQEYEAA